MTSPPAAYVVAGMHRSGTSFVASLLEALDVNMGSLLAGDRYNRPGYFEDTELLAFQKSMLGELTADDVDGFPDWGWNTAGGFDAAELPKYRDAAAALVQKRRDAGATWGWKEPRTSVLLDFWHELAPEAKYVCVYRAPWDVADSIFRVGTPYFLAHPAHALLVWEFYNRRIMDFVDQHPERCIVANVNGIIAQPARFGELLHHRLELPVTQQSAAQIVEAKFSKQLFHARPSDDPFVQLCEAEDSPFMETWRRLESAADLPSPAESNTEVARVPLYEAGAALVAPHVALQVRHEDLTAELYAMRTTRIWKLRSAIRRLIGIN